MRVCVCMGCVTMFVYWQELVHTHYTAATTWTRTKHLHKSHEKMPTKITTESMVRFILHTHTLALTLTLTTSSFADVIKWRVLFTLFALLSLFSKCHFDLALVTSVPTNTHTHTHKLQSLTSHQPLSFTNRKCSWWVLTILCLLIALFVFLVNRTKPKKSSRLFVISHKIDIQIVML